MVLPSLSRRRIGPAPLPDLALAAALMLAMVAQVAADPKLDARPAVVAAWLAGCGLVGARRAAPLAAAALLAALVVSLEVAGVDNADNPMALFLAALVVAYSVGAHLHGAAGTAGLVLLVAAELAAMATEGRAYSSDWAAGVVVNVVVWFVGVLVRTSRGRAHGLEHHLVAVERATDRREREAALVERARIARELHDVIAHSVTLMTVQAGAGQSVIDRDPARAREALAAVQDTGRRTVEDLRRLLGLLRDADQPQGAPEPSLDGVPALAEQISRAGLPVDVAVEGEPAAVSPGLDATAYRIVQEALVNALRHAGAGRARVVVAYEADALRLEVSDDGRGAGPAPGADGGHGLIGMRERVAVFGGRLEIGDAPAGGFGVRAVLPLRGVP